jgi:hypothetical protein
MMDSTDILRAVRRDLEALGIELLLAFHDGAHFIEKPNAVMALSGFKALGHALVILPQDEEGTLAVTPAWDVEREQQNVARLCAALEPITC